MNRSIKILGNGPSLPVDLESHNLGKEEDFLSVNFMPNQPMFEALQPKYHFLTAPEFFITHNSDIKTKYDLVFDSLVTNTTWPLTIIVSSRIPKNHPKIQYLKSNPNISIYPINLTPVEGLRSISFKLFDWGWGMPRPHNVLIPSLIFSIRMGYKKIYILGADHSWLKDLRVDEKNNALLNQKHFYDENTSTEKPMLMHARRPRLLHEILHKFYLSFKSYHEIKAYAQTKGVNIYNCTRDSFIDAFEKI